ncbi:bifunctional glycosyltransferase family 2/GtrA family protein [Aminipila sp.]|uniref:bifunctional glycosyltransferase family 2/GtrA family protein n=1 Tax=Aminipila sp. TaxID=2060095 RepID=UPI0028A2D546|nr:bifunctional glycosyltransferase family 2/GtrA family protein [Aminipila sp.]
MAETKKVFLVIPAFEPDQEMICLIQKVHAQTDFEIIIVDDGSGEAYAPIFKEAGNYAYVISYGINKGKGYALKTAFSYIAKMHSGEGTVVTADSDGQHSLEDITAVAEASVKRPDSLVLGRRQFAGKVPIKSRLGNSVTRKVFELSSGIKVGDTQTGLRGVSVKELPYMIRIEGNRYEYETNMLLYWTRDKKDIYEQPIETIYLNENKGSHFHPLKDSYQIYKEIIKFSFSSGIGFLADYFLYALLIIMTQRLPLNWSVGISNITARIVSAMINYAINRKYVFKDDRKVMKTAVQYIILAVIILILNTLILSLLINTLVPNRFIAKIIAEIILFVFSCFAQKKIIFRKKLAEEGC